MDDTMWTTNGLILIEFPFGKSFYACATYFYRDFGTSDGDDEEIVEENNMTLKRTRTL